MRFLLITEPARCSSVLVVIQPGELPDEALARYCNETPSLRSAYREWEEGSELQSLAAWLQDTTGDCVQFVNATRVVGELAP